MQIALVGAGALGADIAQVIALSETPLTLIDTDPQRLRQVVARISQRFDRDVRQGTLDALVGRRARRVFTLSAGLDACARANVVIEAAPDTPDAKRALLDRLDALIRPDALLATTTNAQSVTALASTLRQPARLIGLHFLRPAHRMGLVEVVRTPYSTPDGVERAVELVQALGKTPLVLEDTPGWVVNRLATAYFGEALAVLDAGAGLNEATVDKLMEAAGFPMGPFRLMDYLGVDTALRVAETLYEASFHTARYRPHPRQRRLVEAGRLGQKSALGGFLPPEKRSS